MNEDPMEPLLVDGVKEEATKVNIEVIETSIEWNTFRKDIANEMYNAWSQTSA